MVWLSLFSQEMVDGLAFTLAILCWGCLAFFSVDGIWFGLHFSHVLSGFVQLLFEKMVDACFDITPK